MAYSLPPEQAVFPTQLHEATATLSHLIAVCGRRPSSILLAGDSAGGALTLALLSHILHPKTGVPRIVLQEPLRGALVLSPWVSFSTEFDSYTRNAESDTITPSVLKKWATMYIGEMDASDERAVTWPVRSNDVYAEAFLTMPEWWRGLNHIVDASLIWTGGKEILRDPIVDFVSRLKEGWKAQGGLERDIILVEGRNEAHIGPILNVSLGNEKKRSSQVAIEAWLLDRLSPIKKSTSDLPAIFAP